MDQPSAEDFTTLVSVARYNIGPQDGLFSPGWAYLPTEYLYFDPRLVEDRQGTEAEVWDVSATAAASPTEDLLWLHFADGGHGSPYRLVRDPSTLSRPLDLPLSSVITTPDGQTIDLGARQEGETAFVAAFISPATGMDTGYRIYVRGEETYLALFRQDVLAYLAQVQWTVRATHPEELDGVNPQKQNQRTAFRCALVLLRLPEQASQRSPPAGEKSFNHVLTGSAGKTYFSPECLARKSLQFSAIIFGRAQKSGRQLASSYAVFPNEAQTPVPLPKFSYRNCSVFGRTASRFCSFRS